MPIGFHLANNFALVVLIGEKGSTDVLQSSPLIMVDKLPSIGFLVIAAGVLYLLILALLNRLITRREQNAAVQ